MNITTSSNGVSIKNNDFFGSYSNYSFAAVLYNAQRIDRKGFEKIRKYMLTEEYATRLVRENIDLFN